MTSKVKHFKNYTTYSISEARRNKMRVLPYASFDSCQVCNEEEELRYGVCWKCAPCISSIPIQGGHEIAETDNPENIWFVTK